MLPQKVRDRGIGWLLRRLIQLSWVPFVVLATLAASARRALIRRLILLDGNLNVQRSGTLFAIYDLDVYPISYDILWFLVWADLERERKGLNRLQCVFVPIGDQEKREFPPGYDAVVDRISREWRFRNICLPAADLLSSSRGVTVCESKEQLGALRLMMAHQIPDEAPMEPALPLPTIYRQATESLARKTGTWGLRASEQGKRYVRDWLAPLTHGRRSVVITLRQYDVDAPRNSNRAEWARFARWLDPARYCPIVVPDTDKAFEPHTEFEGVSMFREAAWSIPLRAALYEVAWLNMFVNCGPGSLCILNSACRYLFFKVKVEEVQLASAKTLKFMGFAEGRTPAFATPFQRWVWEDDRLEVLQREFGEMAARIDDAERRSGDRPVRELAGGSR